MQPISISRRSLARGAIWSVPVLIASTAAPAIAASAEPSRMLWSSFPQDITDRLRNPAMQTVDGTGITAALDRPLLAHPGDNWRPTADGRLVLRSNRVTAGDALQTLTLTFEAPVTDVSVTVEDLDRDSRDDWPTFQDEVFIPEGSAPFSSAEMGSRVIGEGNSESPFRADDGVDGDFGGPEHQVTLTWEGPVSEISIAYRQGVQANVGAYPTIWLSPVTFTPQNVA